MQISAWEGTAPIAYVIAWTGLKNIAGGTDDPDSLREHKSKIIRPHRST